VGYKAYVQAGGSQALGVVVPGPDDKPRLELLTAGENPPVGVLIHYRIGEPVPAEASLSFWTAGGELIRRFSSADEEPHGEQRVRATPGIHRFVWDMRYPDAAKLDDGGALSAYWGGSVIGPVAVPGTYQVRLEAGGQSLAQEFAIVKDPRVAASQEDLQAQFDLLLAIRDKLGAIHEAVTHSRQLRGQLGVWQGRLRMAGQEGLAGEAGRVAERLLAAEGGLVESRSRGGADVFNYPPQVNRKLASLQSTVAYGDARPPEQCFAVFEDLRTRADDRLANLRRVIADDLGGLNARIAAAGVPVIG
jgi:hypothetical protein